MVMAMSILHSSGVGLLFLYRGYSQHMLSPAENKLWIQPIGVMLDQLTFLGSNISSTESDVKICLAKTWTTIDRLSVTCKSDLPDKIKRDFFHAVAVSILLYGCTIRTQTKSIEKKLDGNYLRMLCTVLNKFWK